MIDNINKHIRRCYDIQKKMDRLDELIRHIRDYDEYTKNIDKVIVDIDWFKKLKELIRIEYY